MTYPEMMFGVEYEWASIVNAMTGNKETMNATLTAYQTGATDFLILLDAQRQLLEFG